MSKDAKGHGSEKRNGPVIKKSDHSSYRIMGSSIPGLQYVKDQISASKYFTLQHAASGKTVGDFRSAPVREKDSAFIDHIDNAMRQHGVDWTKGENELGITPEKGLAIRNSLSSAVERSPDGIRIKESGEAHTARLAAQHGIKR